MTRLHDKFVDMTDGHKVELKEITQNSLTDNTAVYVLSDMQGKEIRTSDLTCFRFVGNDTPMPKPDPKNIVVRNGKLFVNNVKMESGELFIEELLQVGEDTLLLSVQAKNKKNASELFRYYISDDKFLNLSHNYSVDGENKKVSYERVCGDVDSDFICLKAITAISVEYSIETEGSTEMRVATQLSESAVFFEKCYICADAYDSLPGTSKVDQFVGIDGEMVLLFAFASTNEEVEGHRGIFKTIPREDGKALYIEVVINLEYDTEEEKEKLMFSVNKLHDMLLSSKGVRITHDGRNSLLIFGEDSIVYTNNGYTPRVAKGKDIVEAVKRYPIFVSLEPGTRHNTFVFSNANYETIRISVTKTNDRGFVTSIES